MRHELFGGALSIEVPEGFVDMSSFRQVPDHQEVFLCSEFDSCLIIELNQRVEAESDRSALATIWNDLAEANDSRDSQRVLSVEEILTPALVRDRDGSIPTTLVLAGEQLVSKYKDALEAANLVRIHLALIRLACVATDLVVSISAPLEISNKSSTAGAGIADPRQVLLWLNQSLGSLRIDRWDIFGE
jgi:hypothetical protein